MNQQCNIHKIPVGAIELLNKRNVQEFEDDDYLEEEELDAILKYLQENNYDFKYGDLIELLQYSGYRNQGIYIFDGKKIINLEDDPDDYGTLPRIFKVLQKNEYGFIPSICYWHNNFETTYSEDDDTSDIDLSRRIEHNSCVWFDHQKYIDAIKANIKCDNFLVSNLKKSYASDKIIYSSFELDSTGETIYIMLDDVALDLNKSENAEKLKTYFAEVIDTEDTLYFNSCSCYYPFISDKNILYLICEYKETNSSKNNY